VSYNHKNNEANGELNRDGDSHNLSYNLGVEGKTNDPEINETRKRQMRNFMATLICSQGVPFITAGDEKMRSQLGNNNGYCQDNDLSWLEWEKSSRDAQSMHRFVRKMLAFRQDNPSLRKTRFFSGNEIKGTGLADVTWLNLEGEQKNPNDWNVDEAGAFAMMIHREASDQKRPLPGFLLFLFNARTTEQAGRFPKKPDFKWECIIDTVDPEGESSAKPAKPGDSFTIEARSLQIWRELT
jgi:isoamylase